jgi:hypothetical protein
MSYALRAGHDHLRPNADLSVNDARGTINHTLCLAPLDYPRQPGQSIL